MCGICGIVRFDGKPVDRAVLKKMNDTMVHRGPDDDGIFIDGSVGIAARRLSIIDVAGGHQPVARADNSYAVAQNGEIYNFRELKSELKMRHGSEFRSHSDTEVLLEAYAAWGSECLERLNGMFAVAFYERASRSVLIARDRAGIKPMHYCQTSNCIVFASEIKALLAHPEVQVQPDMAAIDAFLKYKYIPADRTPFENIRKLLPGHMMAATSDGRVSGGSYWSLGVDSFAPQLSKDEAQAALRKTLFSTVERQMVSDVPLGAFLSGGIDSTIIAGIMARVAPGRVKTFCMGFHEESFNELPFARLAAAMHGTDHHEFICEAHNLLELVPELIAFFDEPLGDASMIPTYLVARETRKHVTVALAGTGADELFAGYDRHRMGRYRQDYMRLPSFLRNDIVPAIAKRLKVSGEKKGRVHRLKRFLKAAGMPEGDAYENLTALFPGDDRKGMFCEGALVTVENSSPRAVAGLIEKAMAGGLDFLQAAMVADLETILPNDYLMKDDRMSMASSLEVRVPFLDHDMLELSARIPSKCKLRRGVSKAILRDTFADLIPERIRKRGKYGFEAPIALWMEGDRLSEIRQILAGEAARKRGIIDINAVNAVVDRHAAREENCMNQIFSLLTLEYWFRRYID